MLKTLREKDIRLDPRTVKGFHLFVAMLILALFGFFVALIYLDLLPPRKDLYNELWGPAHLLVNGESPYDTASLDPVLPAAWLPMSIGFFAPLGWLDEETALHAWFVFNLVVGGGVVLLAQGTYKPAYLTFVTALFAFAFPPTVYHLLLGQFSLVTTLCAIAAAHLLAKERHWAGAFLLALGLSKPHLMTLSMLGWSAWYFQRGGARSVLGFWARAAAAAFTLCLPLFIGYPNWIPDAVVSMTSNAPWAFPTLLKLFQLNFGAWGTVIWGILSVGVAAFSLFVWRRFDPITAACWSLGLALLVSPYLGSWDFVALLPLLILSFARSGWGGRTFLAVSYLAAWYGMSLIQALERSHNHYFWWVPVWFLIVPALVTKWQTGAPGRDLHQFTA